MGQCNHSIIYFPNGDIYSAGQNYYGQLGTSVNIGKTTPNPTYIKVASIPNIKQVVAGSSNSAIVTRSGDLYTNGYNGTGMFGVGSAYGNVATFTKATTVSNVTSVAIGNACSLAITNDKFLYTCGSNNYGNIGLGSTNTTSSFTKVTNIADAKQASSGFEHSAVCTYDGSLYTCGSNTYGQLGLNTGGSSMTQFTKVSNISTAKQVACGQYHTIVVTYDGYVYAAGYNNNGQLGNGTTSDGDNHTFTKIEGLPLIDYAVCSTYNTILLSRDGRVYGCGPNTYGQLPGTLTTKNSFVEFPGITTACDISTTSNATFIKLVDGTLLCCGYNYYGELGLGDTTDRHSLTQSSLSNSINATLWDVQNFFPYYLIKDSNSNLLTYSGIAWSNVGTSPSDLTTAKFKTYGMNSLPTTASISALPSQTGNSLIMLTDDTSTTPTMKVTGVPNPKFITFALPIDLTTVYKLSGILSTTAVSGSGYIGLIFSNDNGITWKSAGGIPVDIKSMTDIKAKSTNASSVASISKDQLLSIVGTSKSLLLGIYIELQASTDTATCDSIGYSYEESQPDATNFSYTMKVNDSVVRTSTYSSSDMTINETLDHTELKDGTNDITFDIANQKGDTATLSFNVTKEPFMRTSVKRVFKSYSGGFKKNDVIFDTTNVAVPKWDTSATVVPIASLGSGTLLSYPIHRKTQRISFTWF